MSGKVKEMMFDPSTVDLEMLALALQDDSYESSGWVDPVTGEVLTSFSDEEAEEYEERGLVWVKPGDSRAAYRDMVDFTALVDDDELYTTLSRALQGRGAFCRFKDVIYDHEHLRQDWFAFSGRRVQVRALDWLVDSDLISQGAADAALAAPEDEPTS